MNNMRSKGSNNRYSNADATDYAFNQYAGATKVLGPVLGQVTPMKALDSGKQVTVQGALVAVYNDSNVTSFVCLSKTSTFPVSIDIANGAICVPPYSYITVVMGENLYIKSNIATTYGYEIADDLNYNVKSGIV